MLIAGVDVELRAVTVLGTSAAVKADDELPDWAPLTGKMSASFDAAHFEKAARVRIDITATGDDGMYAVRAELLCEFAVSNGASFTRDWPESDAHGALDAVWPHARGALQAAAFSVDQRLPLRRLPPEPHSH